MKRHIFYDGYEYKIFRGASWLKIFYQDADLGNFTEVDQAKSCNETGKFSILEKARDMHHYWSDKYEFLLEYPSLQGFNRWQQSIYPLDASNDDVGEFFNVSCSWTVNYWKGLQRYTNGCALLEGSIGNYRWYYAIGMKVNCHRDWPHYFPGPSGKQSKVYLWMRVPDIKGAFDLTCKCSNHRLSRSFVVIVFLHLS